MRWKRDGEDASSSTTVVTWEELSEHLQSHGAKFESIEVRNASVHESRGVYAREDVITSQKVVEMPRKLIISVAKSKESPLGRRILAEAETRNSGDVPDRALLQAYLIACREGLEESGKVADTWRRYLRHCPGTYENPLYWSQVLYISVMASFSSL